MARTGADSSADTGSIVVAILLLSALPAVLSNVGLRAALWGAAAFVVLGTASVFGSARAQGRVLEFEFVARRPHYLQAVLQAIIYAYWGYHFRLVYDQIPLIAAQLAFAYAFDMLLAWSHRDRYTLGFGQFPIIFSINLFLWFKPDWFYLQFLMIAVGFAAKELIRWEKDGRRVHVFNPSSFPLGLFSLGLLLTGSTGITWGQEIANTFELPPYIRPWIFLIGLPGQYLFGVTTMTMSAVVTVVLFNLGYVGIFGTYFFIDAYVPAAVFLGMHLLFTDPSTSPRTEAGRILFGCLYGLSTVALYQVLGALGLPMFYDKLLQVPVLNLTVRGIDRMVNRWGPAKLLPQLAGPARNAAYMGVWAVVFAMMSAAQGVGDQHPGQWLPFWRQACADQRAYACSYYADMTLTACRQGSSWACNETGLMHLRLARSGEDARRENESGAREPFEIGRAHV